MYQSNIPPQQNAPPEPKDLVDPKVILGWCVLFLGFIKKRKWIPVITTFAALVLAIVALQVLPRTYESEMTMQAKKSEYLSPDQAGRLIDDAQVVLKRRVTLIEMVQRTNLVKEWRNRREPIFRLKDQIYTAMFGPTSDKDLESMLAYMLQDALTVSTEGDTITINVAWRDPELAFALVSAAQQAFLEERQVQEIAMLSESMGILQNHAAKLEREIQDEIGKAQSVVQEKNQALKAKTEKSNAETAEKLKGAAPVAGPRTVPLVPEPQVNERDVERLASLQTAIASKREELNGVTAASRSAVGELQGKLAQARAIYKEAHPVIGDLKQRIQVASADPPMAARLRSELAALEDEQAALQYKTNSNPFLASKTGGGSGRGVTRLGASVLEGLKKVEEYQLADPDIEYARSQIGFAMRKYQDTQLQIDQARIKLDTAQAAFQHRYRVVTPAEVPNKPTKPQPGKVIPGALIAGLALGLFIALALEIRRGLIYEPWQVETSLGLPVVANIELGSKSHGFQ